MTPEVVLFYSANAYGTADAIFYDELTGVLRIHDLKTGVTPGSMDQAMIYAALFLLDYRVKPRTIFLRIYQNDEILEYEPTYEEVMDIADKIVAFDKLIETIKEQAIF
jgi:hypothetical protein